MRDRVGGTVRLAAVACILANPAALATTAASHNGRAATTGPSLRVVAGYGEVGAAAGDWVPASVDIQGGRDDLSGTLVVSTLGAAPPPASAAPPGALPGSGFDAATRAEVMRYEVPVELAAGQTRSMSVAVQAIAGPLHAELHDASGRVVAHADVAIPTAATGHILVAIVDDGQHRLGTVSGVYPVGTGRYGVDAVELTPAALPDDAVLLRSFLVIVVDSVATGSLTERQRRALSDYVEGGGGLAVATGGAVRQVLEGIPTALLPGSAGAPSSAPLAPAWAAVVGTPAPPQAVETAVLIAAPGAATVLADQRGTPLLLARSAGEGRVVLAAVDPGAGPLASWPGQRGMVGELLATAAPGRLDEADTGVGPFGGGVGVVKGAVDNRGRLTRVLTDLPGIVLPSAQLVAVLMVAYVLVAGPLSYLVLARLRRRDLLWVTVPVLALACGVAAYTTGLGTRGTAPVVTEVRVVELTGADRGLVDTTAAVYTPRGGSATLHLGGGGTLSGFAPLAGDPGELVSHPGDAATVELSGSSPASIHGFSAERLSASPPGGIEQSLARTGTRLRGQLVNHLGTDLVDAVVIGSDGTRTPLGRLRPGAAAAVDTSVDTPFGDFAVIPGRCPGCLALDAGGGDRTALRQRLLSEAVQMRAQGDHPGVPLLVAVADRPLLAADLSANADVDTLDALILPLAANRVDSSQQLSDPGRLVFSDAQDPGGQGVGPRTATYLANGNSAVVDYRLPALTGAPTVGIVGTDVTCFACLAGAGGAGAAPPQLGNGAQVVSYDYLDPSSGAWRPVALTRDNRGNLVASLDVSRLQGADLLLRIRVQNDVIALNAPAVLVGGGT